MKRLVHIILIICVYTYAYAQGQFNYNKWLEEQEKAKNPDKIVYDEDLLSHTAIYGNAFIQAGHLHGPGMSIGGFLYNANLELGYVHGLSESYQIQRHYNGETHGYTYHPKAFDAKVGYGFCTLGCLRITPQVGATFVQINGLQANETYTRNKEKGTAIGLTGSLRVDFSFTKHFGMSIVPQFSKRISEDSMYKTIVKEDNTKDIELWTEGTTCRFGLYLIF